MKLNVLIFGSTGMIGKGVLLECLASAEVESVLIVNRQTCRITHQKLKKVISKNISDLSAIQNDLVTCNACFFCLGEATEFL